MTVWKNAQAEIYHGDGVVTGAGDVKIDAGQIVVSYLDEGQWVVYEGAEIGLGHFELTCPRLAGRATLHRSPDSQFLEGHWIEQGREGMWRIFLDEE